MKKDSYYIVNGITLYRLMAAPVLVWLIFTHQVNVFKWLLAISFFTDLIDGWLARRFKATSILGARLDSIADDLTVVAGMVAVVVLKPAFLKQQMVFFIILFALFLIQIMLALLRYGKVSSFHTYSAKFAALMQGSFFILLFFLPQPLEIVFYIAFGVTLIDLVEEIILVMILPQWEANVKGLYWVKKRNYAIKKRRY
jgi:CDP-diacylglycerol--glycerol-3-phosphate 3-phosphatidyltransferase